MPQTNWTAQAINALASLIGAAGLALLLPLAMLAVGTPVVLGVRGLLEAIAWLLAINR